MTRIMGLVLCLVTSLSAHAQIWNLANDFSINSNPNGQWSYGSTPTVGGEFTAFTQTAQIPYQTAHGAVAEWVGTYFSGFELFPYISKWYGDPGKPVSVVTGSIDSPGVTIIQRISNGVGVHPAPPGQGYAVLRWTAPKSTNYILNVTFLSIVVGGVATTDVHVLKNYVSLFDGDVNASGPVQNWFSGTAGIALNAGDVIDLVIGPNGDYGGDSTGVDAAIQQLPKVLYCEDHQNVWKVVEPGNNVSSAISPSSSGLPEYCGEPSSVPSTWYIKTSWDNGATWQWVDTLGNLGLGQN